MGRWLRRGGAAVLILALALGLAATAWMAYVFQVSLPREAGALELPRAPGSARIVRDRNGVAHIFGDNDAAVFFALGFTHASERFFQMDLTRRYVRGQLADLFGRDYLRIDARTRTLGYARLSEALASGLTGDTRDAMEAYVAGVNARVEQGKVAPEYALLRTSPRAWTLTDSAAVLISFADDLAAGAGDDVDRARLAGLLNQEQIDQFLSVYPDWAPTTLKDSDLTSKLIGQDSVPLAEPENRPGSNAWVVSGARSETGLPLLANDPHLGLSTPSVWYYVRLNLSFGPVIGVSAPGVPFVLLGRNAHGAWGFTNTGFDVIDMIERDPDAVEISERREYISIDGGDEDVEIVVRETGEGPVLDPAWFDLDAFDPARIVVRRSTINMPGNRGADASYALMQSTDWGSFVEAGRGYTVPMQNQHYAGVDGTIGYTTAGLLPIRDPDTGDWTGFVPFDDLPRVVNPAGGYIASGNNLVAGKGYAYPLPGTYSAYRAPRIEAMIEARERHSVDSFAAMQLDVHSELIARILPMLLRAEPESELAATALARLANWDGAFDASGPEGLIASAWLRELSRSLWSDELGEAAANFFQTRRAFLERVLGGDSAAWCDDVTTPSIEDCAITTGRALDAAVRIVARDFGSDIDSWVWGRAHQADFDHPLGGLPLIGSLFENRVPVPGDGSTVNVAHFSYSAGNFDVFHAASMRAIYDLSDLNRSRFMHAPGQSGHPLSPHHGDLAEPWARGEYFEIRDDWSWEKPPEGARVLTLLPSP
ncbi:MAG: penicillin acylase family protein [Halieaceae bacterium]|jgi:penicillin amidase|nr:penicillin acylase family protein [Halieaceae bacterium]